MLGRIKETDLTVPYRDGGYFYYSRTEKGKQYPIYCRKKGSLEAPEEVFLDVNELAKGEKFMAVGALRGQRRRQPAAYTTDITGFREYTLYVKDLRTGELCPSTGRAGRVGRPGRPTTRRSSTPTTDDGQAAVPALPPHASARTGGGRAALRGEGRALPTSASAASRSKALPVPRRRQPTPRPRCATCRPTSPPAAWKHDRAARERPRVRRRPPRRSLLHPHQQERPQLPRRHGAGRRPAPANWKEIVPHRADVMLEGIDCLRGLTRARRARGRPAAAARHRPAPSGDVAPRRRSPRPSTPSSPSDNPEFDTRRFRFGYQSFVTPPSVYDYDMATRQRDAAEAAPRCSAATTRTQLHAPSACYATAPDGAKVPISLVYRKGAGADGKAPLLPDGLRLLRHRRATSTFSSNRLQPARPRRRLRARPHPRRRRARQDAGTTRAGCCRRRTPSPTSSPAPSTWSREKYTSPRPARDRGRQRRRPADGRGHQHAARPLQGRRRAACRSST